MCALENDDDLEDEFEMRVERQRRRIEAARGKEGQSFWAYVGLIGTVGWSVVVPMVMGVFLGMWLDRRYGTGSKWTLGLLVFGLAIGCFNAWRSITKEQ